MSPRAFVLDSWALLAFFEDERPASERVEALLLEAQRKHHSLLMSVVDLGEVWYSVARAYSPEEADQAVERALALGVQVIPADWAITRLASTYKARARIAYADGFALALARARGAVLVTGAPEFRAFEGEAEVLWV